MAGSKSRGYNLKLERELDVTGLRAIEPVNHHLTTTVDYRNNRLLNKSSHYDDDMAHKLDKIEKKISVQMKDRTFSRN